MGRFDLIIISRIYFQMKVVKRCHLFITYFFIQCEISGKRKKPVSRVMQIQNN